MTLETDTLSLIKEIIESYEEQAKEDNLPEILAKPTEHLTLEDINRLADKRHILNDKTEKALRSSMNILTAHYANEKNYLERAGTLIINESKIRYQSLEKRHAYLFECYRSERLTRKQCKEMDDLTAYFKK